jgi:hypothetical protein
MSNVFQDVTPCSVVDMSQWLGGTSCFCLWCIINRGSMLRFTVISVFMDSSASWHYTFAVCSTLRWKQQFCTHLTRYTASCQSLTMEAWVRSENDSCGILGEWSSNGRVFAPSTVAFTVSIISPVPHVHLIIFLPPVSATDTVIK